MVSQKDVKLSFPLVKSVDSSFVKFHFLLLLQLRPSTTSQDFVYNYYTQHYNKRILLVSRDKAMNS